MRASIVPELVSRYDPFEVEERWAQRWKEQPFKAQPDSDRQPFCVVIPPPNVTGNLHLGHAFDNTIIDALIRFKRMQGYETLYQPGIDHAGISTQVVVERAVLAEEGVSRHDLGRAGFLNRVWDWKEKYGGVIVEQLQRLGISADWSRLRFTMDDGLSRAVRKQFVDLYHKGLIYRGERIVNWDPRSQTTLSELEVDREERPGKLYTLAYQLLDGSHLNIATVRPETIFGDFAVAVNPDDNRFTRFLGEKVRIPLTDRWIPVIADAEVDMEFGSGVLKVTPAHDPTDFEIGERHSLPRFSIIDRNACLTSDLVPPEFRGLDRFEARERVVESLRDNGVVVTVENHTISIGISERTGEPVEPILSEQWFYNTESAAKRALEALRDGDIRLHPHRYTKVNRDWLANLRHWNVSRQLWWGHQIPAWYDHEGNTYVPDPDDPFTDPPNDPRYGHLELVQDPDVFDTWFSSNLWPFSTLGWPDVNDPFFRKFYPTSVLVTGYDILFSWVARMEMSGYHFTGSRPFRDVLLHGLILDEHGRKMSKSKNNGIDPLVVIGEYGADALRFAMAYASTGGQDIRWDPRRVEMGRNFNNKLWNAARFVFINIGKDEKPSPPSNLVDRWMLSRLHRAVAEITEQMESFELGQASRSLYDFVWSEFCDWYLESSKPALRQGDPGTRSVLSATFKTILKVLHPLIPFITSEIYAQFGDKEQLGWSSWPEVDDSLLDPEAEQEFERLREAVGGVRNLRKEANLSPSQHIPIFANGVGAPVLYNNREVFQDLTRSELLDDRPEGASISQAVPHIEIILPFAGLVNVTEWRNRQERHVAELIKDRDRSTKKLSNDKFVENAPKDVVDEERRRLAETEELINHTEASLLRID
jgi:valyl-tRNA synthetase